MEQKKSNAESLLIMVPKFTTLLLTVANLGHCLFYQRCSQGKGKKSDPAVEEKVIKG